MIQERQGWGSAQILRTLARTKLDEELRILSLHGLYPFPIVVKDALMAISQVLRRHRAVGRAATASYIRILLRAAGCRIGWKVFAVSPAAPCGKQPKVRCLRSYIGCQRPEQH